MGALATSKSTQVSVVVPMTGFIVCSGFCYYLLFDEKHRQDDNAQLPMKEGETDSEVAAFEHTGDVEEKAER